MVAFIIRRLVALPFLLLALSFIIVALMQLLGPERLVSAYITTDRQAGRMQAIIRDKGLDRPLLIRYGYWLRDALKGDLGFSKASGKPVVETIKERFPATLELALYALIPVLGFGVWFGTLAGLNKNKLIDQIARVFAVITFNIPTFVLGIIMLVVFYGIFNIAPGPGQLNPESQVEMIVNPVNRITGMLSIDALLAGRWNIFLDVARHLVLPVITLSMVTTATILKVTRSSMIETLEQDFVRTARAKGLPESVVNIKHARRNALLPVATFGGFTVVGLLSGAIITETIFAYPGIGSWGASAAVRLDIPGVLGFALFTGVLVVLGNLIVDVMYGVIDPRVRYD